MIAVLHVSVSNLWIRQKQTPSIIFTEPLHNLIWLLLYLTEENSYTIIILLTTCLLIFQCKTYSTKLAFTSMRWLQILKCLLTAFRLTFKYSDIYIKKLSLFNQLAFSQNKTPVTWIKWLTINTGLSTEPYKNAIFLGRKTVVSFRIYHSVL